LVTDWNGRLVLAGWRKGSLFIPARYFKQGENTVLIDLKRSEGDTGREVFLRNTVIHLRFTPPAFAPLPAQKQEINHSDVELANRKQPVDFHKIDPILPTEEVSKDSPSP
jgi:hypothetical protein